MAFFNSIDAKHKTFIENQKMFFVATAPLNPEGHINLSPKGLDCFRVLSETRVAYIDFYGSGNETSAHTRENGRLTFMFCSFDKNPLILRLYGKGRAVLPDAEGWSELAPFFSLHTGTRQIIVADIHKVQTSCGYAVPFYTFLGHRDTLELSSEKKGRDGILAYGQQKNLVSLDGLTTDLGFQNAENEL
jgi:hypothetical protein